MSRMIRFAAAAAVVALLFVAARPRPSRPPEPPAGPTFNKEIVRIFQQHCQSCHHEGDIAPFSLTNYRDARLRAGLIFQKTQSREMPPWKPEEGCGDFAGKRVLPQADIDLIAKWVELGAPEGNPADLPAPLTFESGWVLGQPDMILKNDVPFTPPAHGDTYRCFTIPTNVTAETYVATIDIHPGDRETVHHVIAFIDSTGDSVKLDERDPGPGYTCFGGPGFNNPGTLGGWAPGFRPLQLPEEVAFSLPAASRVVLQVHYHPHHGQPESDHTELGIYLAKKKPSKLIRVLPILNTTFTIPPGNANYKVVGEFPLGPIPIGLHAWAVAPHMHLLGKKMQVEATMPDGTKTCLINIEDWDFNWQGIYAYKEPIAIPPGTRLTATSYFDNSASNPRNPNSPPKAVSWGEETTDEMCIAFLAVTIDAENLSQGKAVDLRF